MFRFLKNHSLIAFYILSFFLSWCIKIPVTLSNTNNVILRLLPSFLPALAALLMAGVIAGKPGVVDLLRKGGKLRVAPVWYLNALLGPLGLNLLALVLAIPFGEAFPPVAFAGIRVLPVVLIATFFALGEELGWRGFALPRLQARFSPLLASLIVGVLWWAWHLPEVLAGPAAGLSLQQIAGLEGRDLVLDVAASILMTWIYNGAGGSVFLVALFHMALGLLREFLALPLTSSIIPDAFLFDLLLCLAAALVLLGSKSSFLVAHQPKHPRDAGALSQPSVLPSSGPGEH